MKIEGYSVVSTMVWHDTKPAIYTLLANIRNSELHRYVRICISDLHRHAADLSASIPPLLVRFAPARPRHP